MSFLSSSIPRKSGDVGFPQSLEESPGGKIETRVAVGYLLGPVLCFHLLLGQRAVTSFTRVPVPPGAEPRLPRSIPGLLRPLQLLRFAIPGTVTADRSHVKGGGAAARGCLRNRGLSQ